MKHWIGIDVSKATLDAALLDEHGKVTAEEQVANTEKGLRSMWEAVDQSVRSCKGECLVCLEPTGHYSHLPLETLVQLEVLTWLAHPTDIIRSIGATRGKNDRIDALDRRLCPTLPRQGALGHARSPAHQQAQAVAYPAGEPGAAQDHAPHADPQPEQVHGQVAPDRLHAHRQGADTALRASRPQIEASITEVRLAADAETPTHL
ncbi:MAG: transposase [Flavobacteriales bacterium]|nr:transposase [Flavobacteriales bacterium]